MTSISFTHDISKPQILKRIESMCYRLQWRQLVGSHAAALETIKLLREVIASARFASFDQLCTHLVEVGDLLTKMAPKEFVIGNMVKRVIILIKEEYASAFAAYLDSHLKQIQNKPFDSQNPSTTSSSYCSTPRNGATFGDSVPRLLGQKLMMTEADDEDQSDDNRVNEEHDFSTKSLSLKPIFIEAVQELYDELDLVQEGVATQAPEHIHSGEVIMTFDYSRTVASFLQSAAKSKRHFTVIVSETAPNFRGRELAQALSNFTPPISSVIVSDASTFALMSRCTKLIIGCHVVFADGSVLAKSGALGLALAARAHLVPVVVVCGMYKFSPVYLTAGEEWSIADMKTPDEVLKVPELTGEVIEGSGDVEVLNPFYDRVPADLISLFITNLGGHPTSLVYRLLKDLYGTT
ncbi:hypothetical protein O181_107454 [Austropuccinia psidii MF-1]|uniref:Translation initiation factor eIF2B subunit beta n=1 Tax=Austropuccinia psidii MF-1 TaxID=1389203 RepID=A0A9Q3PN14_9BASI|nr:hypothetical protein [Austropuccinia psidii MF-1]